MSASAVVVVVSAVLSTVTSVSAEPSFAAIYGPNAEALAPAVDRSATHFGPLNHGVIPVIYEDPSLLSKYSFSYAVYNPHTGEKKNRVEIRDGELFGGQYALVSPNSFNYNFYGVASPSLTPTDETPEEPEAKSDS